MQETWKDIKGYEGLYQVSTYGNVKRIYPKEYNLKPRINSSGYYIYVLYKNNKPAQLMAHRIVANAFIPNYKCKPQVNHIDGNKKNNNINNLEWVTGSENCRHAWKTGLSKVTEKMRESGKTYGKINGKINGYKTGIINIRKAIEKKKIKVNQYTLKGEYIKTWNSITDAAKNNGICKCNISACLKGRYKTSGGYIWKIV